MRLLCFIVVVMSSAALSAAEVSPADKAAIEATAKAFVTAYDAGDPKAIAALWTADGEYSVGTQTAKGRAEIQKVYDYNFRANPGSKMEVRIDSLRSLAPNLLLEEGVASVSGGGANSASAYTAVHTKVDGKWLMASVRESEIPLPAVPESLDQLAGLVGEWKAKGDAADVTVKFEWMHDKHFLRAETMVHPKDKSASLSGGMQVIGVDPLSGRLVSWTFNADGGHSTGVWMKNVNRWGLSTQGVTAEGAVTSATNIFNHAHADVLSWRSVDRTIDGQPLPNTEEIVLERLASPTAK
jgi:uncharacterized protein (TIGR02246 family)